MIGLREIENEVREYGEGDLMTKKMGKLKNDSNGWWLHVVCEKEFPWMKRGEVVESGQNAKELITATTATSNVAVYIENW